MVLTCAVCCRVYIILMLCAYYWYYVMPVLGGVRVCLPCVVLVAVGDDSTVLYVCRNRGAVFFYFFFATLRLKYIVCFVMWFFESLIFLSLSFFVIFNVILFVCLQRRALYFGADVRGGGPAEL